MALEFEIDTTSPLYSDLLALHSRTTWLEDLVLDPARTDIVLQEAGELRTTLNEYNWRHPEIYRIDFIVEQTYIKALGAQLNKVLSLSTS